MLKKVIKLIASKSEEDVAIGRQLLHNDMELFKRFTAIVYMLGEVRGNAPRKQLDELLGIDSEKFFFSQSDDVYRENQHLIYDDIKKILEDETE